MEPASYIQPPRRQTFWGTLTGEEERKLDKRELSYYTGTAFVAGSVMGGMRAKAQASGIVPAHQIRAVTLRGGLTTGATMAALSTVYMGTVLVLDTMTGNGTTMMHHILGAVTAGTLSGVPGGLRMTAYGCAAGAGIGITLGVLHCNLRKIEANVREQKQLEKESNTIKTPSFLIGMPSIQDMQKRKQAEHMHIHEQPIWTTILGQEDRVPRYRELLAGTTMSGAGGLALGTFRGFTENAVAPAPKRRFEMARGGIQSGRRMMTLSAVYMGSLVIYEAVKGCTDYSHHIGAAALACALNSVGGGVGTALSGARLGTWLGITLGGLHYMARAVSEDTSQHRQYRTIHKEHAHTPARRKRDDVSELKLQLEDTEELIRNWPKAADR